MEKFKCIMLIDDDETCSYITEKMISKLNISCRIYSMKNGREALQLIEETCQTAEDEAIIEKCPDLILLDINMPVMDGMEFLEEFYNNPKLLKKYIEGVTIYMLTSSESPVDLEKIKKFNVKGYISKPMTPEKLQGLISC